METTKCDVTTSVVNLLKVPWLAVNCKHDTEM